MAEERKYGVESTFQFPLVVFGSTNADFSTSISAFVAGDVLLIKDNATGIQITNTTSIARIGTLPIFSAILTSTEMQMGKGVLVLVDQSSTKLWEDQALLITTYGSTSALHGFDRDSTSPTVNVGSFTAGAITSTAFTAGAINSTALADSVITAGKLATAAISTANIAPAVYTQIWAESTRSITVVLSGAITSTSFGAGAINSTAIGAGAILESKFATDALTTDVIASGVFTAVNAEVVDALNVDTYGETDESQSASVTASLANKITRIDSAILNRVDVSTSTKTFYTSTGGTAFTKALTDTGLYTEAKATT